MALVLTKRARAVLVLPPPEKRLRPAVFTSMPLMLVANHLGKGSVLLLRQTCRYFYQELLPAVTYNLSLHIGFASVCSAVPVKHIQPAPENKLATPGVLLPAWVHRDFDSTGTGITNAAAVKRMMIYLSTLACPLHLTVHDIRSNDQIFVGENSKCTGIEAGEGEYKNALLLRYMLDSKVQLHADTCLISSSEVSRMHITVVSIIAPKINTIIINRLRYDRLTYLEFSTKEFTTCITRDFIEFANLQRLDITFAYDYTDKLEGKLMAAMGAIPKLTQLTLRGWIPGKRNDEPINAFVNSRPVGAKPLKIELEPEGHDSLAESWMQFLKCAVSFKVGTVLSGPGLKLILETVCNMPTPALRKIIVTVTEYQLRFSEEALDKFKVYNERLPVEQRVRLVIKPPASVDP